MVKLTVVRNKFALQICQGITRFLQVQESGEISKEKSGGKGAWQTPVIGD